MEAYKFIRFERSLKPNKKYDAILQNKSTGKIRRVPFGDSRYEQYMDSTGLRLYSHKDHRDPNRRRLYRLRHAGEDKVKYTPGWFSWFYLW